MGTSDWVTIIASVISGGLTLLGVLLTLLYYRKKDTKTENDKIKEQLDDLNVTRPRLFSDNDISDFKYHISFVLVNHKNPQSDMNSATFKLINEGIKSIKQIFVCTNFPNDISLFDERQDNHIHQNSKKRIDIILKQGDTICLNIKLNGLVNEIISPFLSLWLVDEDDNFWSQGLYCSTGEITNSTLRTNKEVREMLMM